jgi:hypothetical protein
VLLNGIDEIASRADLRDRCVTFELEPIEPSRRKTRAETDAAFAAAHPLILGVLLDTVVTGLKNLPEVKLTELPRMADTAQWLAACDPSMTLLNAFIENRRQAVRSGVNNDAFANAVATFARTAKNWEGPTQSLFTLFNTDGRYYSQEGWPNNLPTFSKKLKRWRTSLLQVGVKVDVRHTDTGSFTSIEDTTSTANVVSEELAKQLGLLNEAA